MQQTQQFSEKEILADALASEKAVVATYNTFATECAHEGVRNAILDCLGKEQAIQKEVFDLMHSKGYYPTPEADPQKIQEAQQKFSQGVQGIS